MNFCTRFNLTLIAAALAVTPSLGQAQDAKPIAGKPVPIVATPVQYDPLGPIPSPLDQTMVKRTYEPSSAINIFALAGQHVHIQLAPDEQIVTMQLSDDVRWKVERVEEEGLNPRLFIKPTQIGIATTMTVVTSIPVSGGSRSYEFLLQSVPEGGRYFRQVIFEYPDIKQRNDKARRMAQAKVIAETDRLSSQELTPALSVETLNWKYDVEGKAEFKPDVVFDDGKFTYLRMPVNAQEWPAVFALEGKEMKYVQVVRKGELLVVQRLITGLLLKLNDAEVKVYRKDAKPRTFWFGG